MVRGKERGWEKEGRSEGMTVCRGGKGSREGLSEGGRK